MRQELLRHRIPPPRDPHPRTRRRVVDPHRAEQAWRWHQARRNQELARGLGPAHGLQRSLEEAHGAVVEELELVAHRRHVEQEVAEYIAGNAADHERDFYDLVHSMRACHAAGFWGILDPEWRVVRGWEHKCAQSHLCPHAVRENQQRLVRRYEPPMLRWIAQKPGRRRLFYVVFEPPNVPRGALRDGKAQAWAWWQAWYREQRDVTPEDRRRWRWPRCKRRTGRWRPDLPWGRSDGVHGVLAHQEDPLSARGDWNVHINAVLLVEGPFSYREAQRAWERVTGVPGARIHAQQIKADPVAGRTFAEQLRLELLEVIKYSAKLTGSPDKGGRRRGGARVEGPPLVAWPFDAFREWYRATKGSRRTRSYGVLFRLPDPEPLEGDRVLWQGEIWWNGTGYRASLFTEDNFRARAAAAGADVALEWPESGPDPPPA